MGDVFLPYLHPTLTLPLCYPAEISERGATVCISQMKNPMAGEVKGYVICLRITED